MTVKKIINFLMCLVMLVPVVFSNPQALLTVQAAETTSETEDENQYETETESQETEDVIENGVGIETYLEEESDGLASNSEETYGEDVAIGTVEDTDSVKTDNESETTDNSEDETFSESVARAGSNKGTATAVTLGTTTTATLAAGATHWYKFTTTGDNSFYRIKFTNVNIGGWADCYIKVYDANDVEQISYGCGSNGTGYEDIKITGKETYYIKIYAGSSSETGKYQVTVSEIKDDVSDIKSGSKALTLGTTFKGEINANGDVDWLKFTTTGNNSFYRINFTNVNIEGWAGCYIKVYDANDVEQISFRKESNSAGYEDIKITGKGTYYIKIYAYSSSATGKYQVTVSEIKDDVSDTKSGSKALTLGTTFKGEINAEGDVDWFKFTTTGNNSFYRINLKNVNINGWNGCYIKVYDANDVEQISFSKESNSTGYEDIKITGKGTYYVKIYANYSSETGKYQVTVSEIKDDTYDTKDKASAISLNKTYTRQINAKGDVDWYKFVATGTVKHRIKLQNINLDSNCYVKLYDSDDVLLQTEYAYNNSYINFDIKLKKNKTYYLEVFSSDSDKTGKYKITVSNPIINTPTSVKASSKSYNSNKITWEKVSGASGYQIYAKSSANGEYKKIATVSSSATSYTHKKLTTGKKYYYKVRAYKKVGANTYYGSFSGTVTSKPSLKVPSSVSVKKLGTGKAKLSWKKVSGASGYEIRRATSYYGTYKKVKTISSGSTTSYTNSKLSGWYYYYKIRAYKTVNGKKVYSGYSTIVGAYMR